MTPLRTLAFTLFALAAFASNSILCRLALGPGMIDPATFTTLRVAAGALTLALMVRVTRRGGTAAHAGGGWRSGAFLFAYAATFSFAYVTLSAGTGALLLFGCVQATMIAGAIRAGERPGPLQWAGLVIALGGLVLLTAPGLSAPSPVGSLLMGAAGVAWGVYTLRGRGGGDPLRSTARNFARAVPFAIVLSLIALAQRAITPRGALLAVASGAIASGVGYVIWYAALRGLSTTRAATVQLSVPVLAALGGILFLSETVTARLALSALLILGGVGLALAGRSLRAR
ncbi:MAG TPA: DMT family transporter [Candidatus Krumholzibacteria bacterium]|nr:DMT family transporter [Candidatus Krumholzibacteria bacterium]